MREYKSVEILSDSERARVELVKDPAGRFAVKKTIYSGNTIYPKLQYLRHNGLVHVYEVAVTDTQTVVIEEYIAAESLQSFIDKNHWFDEKTITLWLKQLCDTISFLHANGIIHRDIKPGNILVYGSFLKLIDFDTARSYISEKKNDTVYLGTKGYAAPEQYGYAQTDARSDIYALGILINQLLTGKISREYIAKCPLEPVIKKCTMIDPEQRYQNAKQILDDLSHPQKAVSRLKKAFFLNQIWKFIVIGIFSAVIISSSTDPANKEILNPFTAVITYLIVALPPLAFAIDFLQVRSLPFFTYFKKPPNKKWYYVYYFLIWFMASAFMTTVFKPFIS